MGARQEHDEDRSPTSPGARSMASSRPSLGSKLSPGVSKPTPRGMRQVLKYKTIEEWCFGRFRDPLALPYELLFRRFCPKRFGDDIVDEFDESIASLKLSHSTAVPLPRTDPNVRKEDLLSRGDVLIARDVFKYSLDRNTFRIDMKDICQALRLELDRSLYTRLETALVETSEAGKERANLQRFFGYMCPMSQPKHWRMFEAWCNEYDALLERDAFNSNELGKAVEIFRENNMKPMLPDEDILKLSAQFRQLDQNCDGLIGGDDLKREWARLGVTEADHAHSILNRWGLDDDDATVDLPHFLRFMCPEEYRPPEMDGFARELLGTALIREHDTVHTQVDKKMSRFKHDKNIEELYELPAPLRPDVDDEVLNSWNRVFDTLDNNGDGTVSADDIVESGLVSVEVSDALVAIFDPQNKASFNRDRFLSAMAEAHSFRPLPTPRKAAPAG